MTHLRSFVECGEESRGRADEVAFRFEFTRKLADWAGEGGEVVVGEWKKELRNLSLCRFYFLVTVLAGRGSGGKPEVSRNRNIRFPLFLLCRIWPGIHL